LIEIGWSLIEVPLNSPQPLDCSSPESTSKRCAATRLDLPRPGTHGAPKPVV